MGRALLMVKRALVHGQFENWLEGHREMLGFGKSSAENFMKLARNYPTAARFLEEELPLREMYERDAASEGDDSSSNDETEDQSSRAASLSSKTDTLLKSLTTGAEGSRRHVSESDQRLDDDQLRQLKLVKMELDRFFEKILNQSTLRNE